MANLCPFLKFQIFGALVLCSYWSDVLVALASITSTHSFLMAAPNPKAMTWIFSYQLANPSDPTAELATIESVSLSTWVQYLPVHVVKPHGEHTVPYLRGILRCFTPRSRLQVLSLMPVATFTPLKGRFDSTVVSSKLKSTYRIGELIEFGSISADYVPPPPKSGSVKRKFQCVEFCNCPCGFNKRTAVVPGDSPSPQVTSLP